MEAFGVFRGVVRFDLMKRIFDREIIRKCDVANVVGIVHVRKFRIGICRSDVQRLGRGHMLRPEILGFVKETDKVGGGRIMARVEDGKGHRFILDFKFAICDCSAQPCAVARNSGSG